MNLQAIILGILITFLFSLVMAEEDNYEGDCKKIYDFLDNKVDIKNEDDYWDVREFKKDLISCKVNNEGKVTEL